MGKGSRGFQIGPLWLHRLDQWDLECWPWLVAHWRYDHGNGSQRIFALWAGGLQLGRRIVRWGNHGP